MIAKDVLAKIVHNAIREKVKKRNKEKKKRRRPWEKISATAAVR